METNVTSRVYNAAEIRTILGISKAATYDLINKAYREKDLFQVIRIGKSLRVPKESFDKWFNSGGVAV